MQATQEPAYTLPNGQAAIAVWWPAMEQFGPNHLSDVEYWVTQRGANVLAYNKQFTGMDGDWTTLHQLVASLRARGYPCYVVRFPQAQLQNNTDPNLDTTYADHILAWSVADEVEDHIPDPNNPGAFLSWFSNWQDVVTAVGQMIVTLRQTVPSRPVFINFNGTHIASAIGSGDPVPQQLYTAIGQLLNKGDIICQDNYEFTATQQVDANGNLMFSLQDNYIGTTLLKQWTGLTTWGTIESCNQTIAQAGQPGWSAGYTFVGSRAPTPQEVLTMAANMPDGIMWFPEGDFGGINDATDPALEATIRQIAATRNPPAPPPVASVMSLTATTHRGKVIQYPIPVVGVVGAFSDGSSHQLLPVSTTPIRPRRGRAPTIQHLVLTRPGGLPAMGVGDPDGFIGLVATLTDRTKQVLY